MDDVPREVGEDLVAWRNRCLRARGRFDIRWRYNGRGGTELEHTTVSRNPNLMPDGERLV
jgi:hypothetical protein